MKKFEKSFYLTAITLLMAVNGIFISVFEHFCNNYPYIFPLPRAGFQNAFLIFLFFLLTCGRVLVKFRRPAINRIIALVYIIPMTVSLGLYAVSVGTGVSRLRGFENERFPIRQITGTELAEYQSTYAPGNPAAIREIVMVSKAGCPYCEDIYSQIEEMAEEFPVSVKYYDCYAEGVHNSEELDEILKVYNEPYVPFFILFDFENWQIIPYSEDMVSQLKEHVQAMARQGFYYTDY